MKKLLKATRLLAVTAMAIVTMQAGAQLPEAIEPVKAPFDMPQPVRPSFPDRSLSISKTGARQGKMATKAIQKAIDRIAGQGGGTVVVPEGKWLTGRIELKSNVNLRVERGAELHFSGNVADYQPAVLTRNEGIDLYSMGAMVYANGAENIAVTGGGKLIAPEYDCELTRRMDKGISDSICRVPLADRVFDGSNGADIFMPVFFGPVNCRNILVEGVTFERSIFWNIVPVYCENTIIRGVTVSSHGHGRTDGIDIDSSVNSLIEYTTLDCGDDCFTLKAGRGDDGVDRACPTENVVIRHCTVKRGVGGITIGSETAGMVRNVYATDVTMEAPKFPIYIKTRRPRGGGCDNIWLEKLHIKSCSGTAINFDMLGSRRWVGNLADRLPARPIGKLTPKFANLTFKDVTIDECKTLINAKGLPEQPIENLTLDNVKAPTMRMTLQDVGKITIK